MWNRRLGQRTLMVAMLASLFICCCLGREALLRGTGSLWIVPDPVTPADAIVVLRENFQVRPPDSRGPVPARLRREGPRFPDS